MNPLQEYAKKRDFKKTREPAPTKKIKGKSKSPIFVVQEHHASHLHYDFRLEVDGVLKSWAVPKGPSMTPGEKRLAVEVEDHPLSYAKFTGSIPEGEYGAGEVFMWDQGSWEPPENAKASLKKGRLEFALKGKKLKGRWLLIRTQRVSGKKNQWLLIKRSEGGPTAQVAKPALKKTKTPKKIQKLEFIVPPQIHIEKPQSIKLTHPEKIIYAKEKLTKNDVAQYFEKTANFILPHLQERPLSILRCPTGAAQSCFFQKNYKDSDSDAIHCIRVREKTKTACYIAVNSEDSLRGLVQMGTVEIHPWNSRQTDIDKPDQMVIDFDPGPGVPWQKVIDASFELKRLLDDLKLESFVKLTGGKGIHVHVPLEPMHSWEQVRGFAKFLADQMTQQKKNLYVAEMSKKLRRNKIFIDYLRNSHGATAVAPYSLRAKETSAVALPLTWQELKKAPSSTAFTLQKALKKIAQRKKDPWADYFNIRQNISQIKI